MAPQGLGRLPFSRYRTASGFVFVSGTIGRDATDKIQLDDVAAQTEQVLQNIQHQLALAGTALSRVVKLTAFVTDITLFDTVNAVCRRSFRDHQPFGACVAVDRLPDPEALVEIEVTSLVY